MELWEDENLTKSKKPKEKGPRSRPLPSNSRFKTNDPPQFYASIPFHVMKSLKPVHQEAIHRSSLLDQCRNYYRWAMTPGNRVVPYDLRNVSDHNIFCNKNVKSICFKNCFNIK